MNTTPKIITAILLLFCLTVACTKGKNEQQDHHRSQGVIIGFDATLCACCGGLVVNLNPSEPISVTNPPRLIKNDPAEFGINSSTAFPINVEIEWTTNVPPAYLTCALGNLIMVTRFKRI